MWRAQSLGLDIAVRTHNCTDNLEAKWARLKGRLARGLHILPLSSESALPRTGTGSLHRPCQVQPAQLRISSGAKYFLGRQGTGSIFLRCDFTGIIFKQEILSKHEQSYGVRGIIYVPSF